jgi:23S rRNA (adenine2503-C2)-methyltransferase
VNVPPQHPIARLPAEWSAFVVAQGERAFCARQIFDWIQRRGVVDPAAMTSLSAKLRAALEADGLSAVCHVEREHRSTDGTRKLAVSLRDGATIETVLLRVASGSGSAADLDADAAAADDTDDTEDDEHATSRASSGRGAGGGGLEGDRNASRATRITQCISTQVGCAMGCVFCASGMAGLKRHLGAEEIVGQVLLGRSVLGPDEQLRNVVFMGMGEPLHNYEATARALRLLTHPDGIGLSSRRVTVSTSGLVPEIERLGRDFGGQVSLAISLHAADDATRSALMPINRRYPLKDLVTALRSYPMPRRRRITIEYTLVADRNDDVAEARRVAKLLRGIPVKINLIPMNPIGASALGPPEQERVSAFQRVLLDAGYSCFVRHRRGDDVAAACGQLVLPGARPKVKGFHLDGSARKT